MTSYKGTKLQEQYRGSLQQEIKISMAFKVV